MNFAIVVKVVERIMMNNDDVCVLIVFVFHHHHAWWELSKDRFILNSHVRVKIPRDVCVSSCVHSLFV